MSQRSLFDSPTGEKCGRCGRPCRGSAGNPEARLLRRASEGLCIDCAVTQFLQATEPIATVLEIKGCSVLLDARIRQQFAAMMKAGFADATPDEIDWWAVVANWDMPLPKRGKGRKR